MMGWKLPKEDQKCEESKLMTVKRSEIRFVGMREVLELRMMSRKLKSVEGLKW